MIVDGIEVLVEGEGEPLVMIHGWPDTHRLWDAQVAAFAPHYRCVRFTLPGFDAGPKRAYTLDEVLAVIEHVIDAACPGQPVTLLVHDWGSFFGYQYAMRHPARVSRVIGVDVGDAGSRRHVAELGVKWKAAVVGYQMLLAIAWKIGGGVGDRIARAVARGGRSPTDPAAIHAQMGYPYYMAWLHPASGYRRVKRFEPPCPMLYVYGARKPFNFHSTGWAEEIAARPGNRVVGLATGHWVMVTQAAAFNAVVLEWLSETSAPRRA